MVVFPPCKINLGLNILRKRADGYHDLSTVFYPIPLTDVLEAVPYDGSKGKVHLDVFGLQVQGDASNNLIVKAYHLLDAIYHLAPTHFCLYKHIPMGAGLGGGSSDGAYAIRLLNQLYCLNLSIEEQISYAAQLGSDCAFFVQDGPCEGSGRGEVLTPLSFSLKGYWISLVKPHIHISTAEAFAGIVPKEKEANNLPAYWVQQDLKEWQQHLSNDFEASLFPKHPVLKAVKESLLQQGALYAAMSGSGSTLFGLFKQKPKIGHLFKEHFYQELELG